MKEINIGIDISKPTINACRHIYQVIAQNLTYTQNDSFRFRRHI